VTGCWLLGSTNGWEEIWEFIEGSIEKCHNQKFSAQPEGIDVEQSILTLIENVF
jgi:hypothetical protein